MDMEENTSKDPENTPSPSESEPAPAKKKSTPREIPDSAAQEAPKSPSFPVETLPTICVRFWEAVLGRISAVMDEGRFHSLAGLATRLGNWAVLAASVLALFLGLVLAIKMEGFQPLWSALGFVLVLSVLHYSAVKFLDSGKQLIEASPTQVSTDAFPRSVALISLVAAIVLLVGSIVSAVQMESMKVFLQAVPGFFVLLFLVWLAINPGLTGTKVAPTDSAGDEAIAIVSFFMKALLRMVPILFGVLTIWGGVVLLVAIVQSFGSDFAAMKGMRTGLFGGMVLLWGTGLPFAAFLGFVLYYLLIDVIRSILRIPGNKGL
jgi:hypothetical protein